MSEISNYEAQKKKLQGLCDEHNFTFRFFKDRYPITLVITPINDVATQMDMLGNVEETGYCSQDSSMCWYFENSELKTKVKGTFSICNFQIRSLHGIGSAAAQLFHCYVQTVLVRPLVQLLIVGVAFFAQPFQPFWTIVQYVNNCLCVNLPCDSCSFVSSNLILLLFAATRCP